MSESFTKDSIREHHRRKIREIINQGGGVEEIVNYVMSRIATVISYERGKHERRNMRDRSNIYEKSQNSGTGQQ